ncbi:hypothetical protein [Streptomyces shenzhenensis]|uniref:hypothetical protein n=1 Tax=Streptomyces shenzhenensis TaxID=943815 RepID=UPI0033DFB1AF
MALGWVHVRITGRTAVSALEDQPGELLFTARSLSGDRILAATVEENEYWILEF